MSLLSLAHEITMKKKKSLFPSTPTQVLQSGCQGWAVNMQGDRIHSFKNRLPLNDARWRIPKSQSSLFRCLSSLLVQEMLSHYSTVLQCPLQKTLFHSREMANIFQPSVSLKFMYLWPPATVSALPLTYWFSIFWSCTFWRSSCLLHNHD